MMNNLVKLFGFSLSYVSHSHIKSTIFFNILEIVKETSNL